MKGMTDFISGFFTWVKLDKELIDALPDKEEPIDPREEVIEPKNDEEE